MIIKYIILISINIIKLIILYLESEFSYWWFRVWYTRIGIKRTSISRFQNLSFNFTVYYFQFQFTIYRIDEDSKKNQIPFFAVHLEYLLFVAIKYNKYYKKSFIAILFYLLNLFNWKYIWYYLDGIYIEYNLTMCYLNCILDFINQFCRIIIKCKYSIWENLDIFSNNLWDPSAYKS